LKWNAGEFAETKIRTAAATRRMRRYFPYGHLHLKHARLRLFAPLVYGRNLVHGPARKSALALYNCNEMVGGGANGLTRNQALTTACPFLALFVHRQTAIRYKTKQGEAPLTY
jgi:hypothetical protein